LGLKPLGAYNSKNYEYGKKAFNELGADPLNLFEGYKKDGNVF